MPDNYDIFLSHHSSDKAQIEQLACWLRDQGFKVWFDKWSLIPGRPWQEGIEEGLSQSRTIAVFIGASGLGQWEVPEMRAALDQAARQKKPVVPIFLPDCPENAELPLFLRAYTWIDFRSGLDNPDARQRLLWAITGENPYQQRELIADASASTQPFLGDIVYKMCNRGPQENDFLRFFRTRLRENPRQPHFYFLHGSDDECHESLIERLARTRIKKYVEQTCGAQYADVQSKLISWPIRGDLETRQEDLALNFMKTFDSDDLMPNELISGLCHLAVLRKHPCVILRHNLDAARWDASQERFIRWYIKAWLQPEWTADLPQFLIFLNIIYPRRHHRFSAALMFTWPRFGQKTISKQLCRIHTSSGEPDPCQLLPELKMVTPFDVSDWFSYYRIYPDEWQRKEKIALIFGNQERCSMSDVEKHLKMIIDECTANVPRTSRFAPGVREPGGSRYIRNT
ncbi:GUN4 domain protein [Candidatus Vecturithrix granuli]|uniref:GUN4 domain protein n=1 Tax=Vecturithrix granuli TaxID=1499967 RepID=A0A081C5G6_VECG1|nr:GUN4 domain protein [Candidatus Vecturithrix granuli]